MRSGKWWPWAVAWMLAAATVAVLVTAAFLASAAKRTSTPTDILAWSTAVIALGTATVSTFRWASKKTHDPPERLPSERIDTAKRFLADAVDGYWKKESQYRDWERRPLMQVRWRAPVDPRVPSHSGAVKNPPQTASSAEIAELAGRFRACEPRRLVILGGPGTGKTTLAVRLLLELLATREGREHEPVPVMLPVAQWDAGRYPRLQAWLTEQLYEDYPGLRWLGIDGVRQLVDLGHVLPILDGLDELPEPAQATVITCLNESLGRDGQVILTSRTTEYIDAVGGGRTLEAAAVLEPLPVTPRAAADYLTRSLQSHQASQPAWDRALEVLGTEPDSALAEVAATPLGLWLLRAIYIEGDGDPDELTDPGRFLTAEGLRAHLFGHLIGALLPPDGDRDWAKSLGLSRSYQVDDVERWLAFLAHHLSSQPSQHDPDHYGTRDFEWWRLAATTGRAPSASVIACVIGLVFGLGSGFAIAFRNGLGIFAGLAGGLAGGLVSGLVFGIGREAARLAEEPPGAVDLRAPWGRRAFISTLMGGLGLRLGLAVGLLLGVITGLILWPIYESALWPVSALMLGLILGFVVGLVGGTFRWLETALPAVEANSPQASLRPDRILNLARIVCGCLVVGLVLGPAIGTMVGFIGGLGPGLVAGLEFGSGVGLMAGPVFGLMFGRHRAWLAYVWASWRLSREGVLPRKLMPFLNDMHRLGLLRAVGRIYQFRHAELQDHLAAAYRQAD